MGVRLTDAQALATALDRLSAWLRRSTSPSISRSTIGALDRLDSEGPMRVSELATAEAISQPGVTVLVNRVSAAGWAERVPDPTDRRAALVRITDAGRAVLAERYAQRARLLRDRIGELDDADQQALIAALPAVERLVGAAPLEGARETEEPNRKK